MVNISVYSSAPSLNTALKIQPFISMTSASEPDSLYIWITCLFVTKMASVSKSRTLMFYFFVFCFFFVQYTCEQSATQTGGCILDVLLIMSQRGEVVVSSSACAVCTCGGLIIACRQSNMLSDAATFASLRHSACSNKSRAQCNLCQAPFTSQRFSEQSCSCWRRLEEPSYWFHIHCSSPEGNLLKNSFIHNLDL